jgi:hypothetical protein
MVKLLCKKTCIAWDFSKIDEQLLIRISKAGNRGLTWVGTRAIRKRHRRDP